MANYFYNGSECPKMPVVEGFSYVYISENNGAVMYLTSKPLTCFRTELFGTPSVLTKVVEGSAERLIYGLNADKTEWIQSHEADIMTPENGSGLTPYWSNYDLFFEDDTLYLAATIPLPVKLFESGTWNFNGTVLSHLSAEWNKGEYPYGIIYTDQSTNQNRLYVTKIPLRLYDNNGDGNYTLSADSYASQTEFVCDGSEWVYKGIGNPHINASGYIWSNYDVEDPEGFAGPAGSVYLAASEPVPVVGWADTQFDLRSWLALYLMGRCGTRIRYAIHQSMEDPVVFGAIWEKAKDIGTSFVPSLLYYNGRVFVVTFNDEVYTSEDGETWDLISTLPTYPSNLTCVNGLFLWTSNKNVYCSSDFINWTTTELALNKTDYFDQLAYGDGRFLLLPRNQQEPMFYSDDGMNWVQLNSKVCSLSGGFRVSYLNGRWYGNWTGSNYTTASVFYRSDNGVDWTQISQVVGAINSPIYADGLFVVPVKKGSWDEKTKDYYYSTDGISWTAGTIFGNPTKTVSLQYVGGLWFAHNYESSTYYSADGINWNPTNLTDARVDNIVYENGIFVASLITSANYYDIAYSYDGITWTQSNTTCGGYTRFEYEDGVFVARGNFGILYSVDGVSWIQSNITENANVWNVEDVGLLGFSNGSLIYPVKNRTTFETKRGVVIA